MNDLNIATRGRGIDDVTRDIRIQTGQFLRTAIEIGRLLYEAKAMVEPGKWGQYIEQELPFSHSWANNYMKLYKEYGSDQISMFGDTRIFMDLSPTQALELLALPAEDREQFAEEHNVAEMSTRDLHKEVQAELDRTQAALRDAEQDKLVLQNKVAALESTEGAWEAEIQKLREKLMAAENAKGLAQKSVDDMANKVKDAQKKAKEAQDKLRELKKNPQIPEEVMAQMQQRFTAEAEAKAAQTAMKELEKLNQKLDQAEAARVAAEEKLLRAQKQNQLSDPDAAVFGAAFQQVQEDFNRMKGVLIKIDGKDPALGQKLHGAVIALLDKLRGEVSVC